MQKCLQVTLGAGKEGIGYAATAALAAGCWYEVVGGESWLEGFDHKRLPLLEETNSMHIARCLLRA